MTDGNLLFDGASIGTCVYVRAGGDEQVVILTIEYLQC